MKRLAAVAVLAALILTSVCVPVFAEKLTVGDRPEAEKTRLIFWNATNLNGEVIRRYELAPRDALLHYADGTENPIAALALRNAKERLSVALAGSGYAVSVKDGVLSAEIRYDGLTELVIANGGTGFEYEPSDAEEKTGFFFRTYTSRMTTVWQAKDDPETIPGFFVSAARALGEAADTIEYVYVYGTKYRPEAVGSDADFIEKVNGVYYHEFLMADGTTDREITLTQKNPNPVGWYVTAILAGFLVAGAVLGAVYLNKRKEKRYGREERD